MRAVQWQEGVLRLLDQRLLPERHEFVIGKDAAAVACAIRDMAVRGAPAIGIAAAYGVALAGAARYIASPETWRDDIEQDLALLAASRPTAVNLFWALERMRNVIKHVSGDPTQALLAEAKKIHEEDIAANQHMGQLGAGLLEAQSGVLTHCNTGSLATGGYGTALGVIRAAHAQGKITQVYAGETRPWLQGARLTAWELLQEHIPVTLIADSAAASLMAQGRIQWVIVGADRIAANGDVANKIGTYGLAVAARHHGVKFMVVAPASTIDMKMLSGADIPIEVRAAAEVLTLNGQAIAPTGAGAWNPAFDVTPAELVDALVTERGVVLRPDRTKMLELMRSR
ncbi:MAG: S-methyl-5-thioribose-1-phosphate isomerase [Gammaproteobacteria bacterium]